MKEKWELINDADITIKDLHTQLSEAKTALEECRKQLDKATPILEDYIKLKTKH